MTRLLLILTMFLTSTACVFKEKKESKRTLSQVNEFCSFANQTNNSINEIEAHLFHHDPIASSLDESLSPGNTNINQFLKPKILNKLTGKGVLEGDYVKVVSGICNETFGARINESKLSYSYDDPRFNELMSYYYANEYRNTQDQNDFLEPNKKLKIIANCDIFDNAYYSKKINSSGQLEDYLCIGKSSRFSKANFAHDASVVIHEIQHSITNNIYSQSVDFNQYIYDEAGAINESLSDYFSLSFLEKNLDEIFDSKIFSRWALGSFFNDNYSRGAHRCPVYDSGFPQCLHFSTSDSGFSMNQNHVSFSYPDGLGWPFSYPYSPPQNLKSVYLNNFSQQQIHVSSTIITGYLYDLFSALKQKYGHDFAFNKMTDLISNTLLFLPKPSASEKLSPVTFVSFTRTLVETSETLGWPSLDQDLIKDISEQRGLYGFQTIPSGWAQVGEGAARTPGMKFIDVLPSSGVSNERFNKGDIGAIFFDIKNTNSKTVASLNLSVEITEGDAIFLNGANNLGYINPKKVMIQYQKINGTSIVNKLIETPNGAGLPISNTFFKTDSFFDQLGTTAIWIEIPKVLTSSRIGFKVNIFPENAENQVLYYEAEVLD